MAAGIKVIEGGYRKVALKPIPDRRLGHLTASIETRRGLLSSHWEYQGDAVKYSFEIPQGCVAELTLPDGRCMQLAAGKYEF